MQRQRSLLVLILILLVVAIVVIVKYPVPLGLDLRGGAQLTLQVKPSQEVKQISPQDLAAVQRVLENRINALGVAESVVQTVGNNQVLVQLPGVYDPQDAERVLGGTAQLEFRLQKLGTETQLRIEFQVQQEALAKQAELKQSGDAAAIAKNQASLNQTNQALASLFESSKPPLKGNDLKDAFATSAPNSNAWEVDIQFNQAGGELFAQLTKKLAGTGRSIGIFLDNALISAPTVAVDYASTGITGGRATISGGNFTAKSANDLAVQLKGGALPFPVEVVENRTVGATLGKDSIQRSIYAGIGGLVLVLIFMVLYYRLPGIIADIALVIYAVLTYAVFAGLQFTLSLAGIAGFILSIGLAVDANVLIFERTREELRAGKTLYRSVEAGFYRAWSSILDSHVTTLIACLALIWLGSGIVRGFGVTLMLGLGVNLFTAITCSRTLLLLALGFPKLRKPELFCPNLPSTLKSQAQGAR